VCLGLYAILVFPRFLIAVWKPSNELMLKEKEYFRLTVAVIPTTREDITM
jgi:hypothetical protein